MVAQFLPFYRFNPTETLRRCTVSAVFSRANDFFFTRL
ncbi:hypothetical protein GVAMD_0802 [Gardnerella vaginalis AMD]|nr:hypothetical protein GVAMD_0802 [Gardnerella vaginalis AMD]